MIKNSRLITRQWFVVLTVFFACIIAANTCAFAELQAISTVHHKNDTLTLKITFFNKYQDPELGQFTLSYVSLSDFAFAQKKSGNYLQQYVPANYGFTTTIICLQNKYSDYEESMGFHDEFIFKLKYLPKLLLIEKNDSVTVEIKQYCPKINFQANENYSCLISIPYLDDRYAFFLDEYLKINEQASYYPDNNIAIDISNWKNRDYKKNYSNLKLSKCDKKILITAFLDHILKIKAEVIFED